VPLSYVFLVLDFFSSSHFFLPAIFPEPVSENADKGTHFAAAPRGQSLVSASAAGPEGRTQVARLSARGRARVACLPIMSRRCDVSCGSGPGSDKRAATWTCDAGPAGGRMCRSRATFAKEAVEEVEEAQGVSGYQVRSRRSGCLTATRGAEGKEPF